MELSWTPSTDRLSPIVSITLEGDASPEVLDEVSLQDGVIRFRLPPAPADAGTAPPRSGHIRFDIRTVSPAITHCEPDPRGCHVTGYLSPGTGFKLPITVR